MLFHIKHTGYWLGRKTYWICFEEPITYRQWEALLFEEEIGQLLGGN